MLMEIIYQGMENIHSCDYIIGQWKNRNQKEEKTYQQLKFQLPKDQAPLNT